jgi:pilus assembly protein Flp/PilA
MKALFVRFINEESGQDLIEYALIALLIGVAAYGTLSAAGGVINGVFTTACTDLGGTC